MFYFTNDDEEEEGEESRQNTNEDDSDEDPFSRVKQKFVRQYSPDIKSMHPKVRYRGKLIFFSRHGESEYNVENKVGGDSPLSDRGALYAKALGRYFNNLDMKCLKVWTSQLLRATSTAQTVSATERKQFSSLNEINAGNFDGLSYDDMEELYPEEFEKRLQDKLGYRYPGGESYIDCCHRISPFLEEFESESRKMDDSSGLLVIAHQAILRCIFGYLLHTKLDEIPYIKIPQHTVIQVTSLPKYDACSGKTTPCETEKRDTIMSQNIPYTEDVCSIEYVRMPIEHAEQGTVRLPE